MVEIYHKYHDMGYNVFGVSLDNKEDRWKQAINDDKLVWSHVSDLKGWKSAGAASYGVSSIPHTVLVDPNGIIVARGLRGDELEAKLAEVFASEVQ
jgi:peroxiredoxin